MTNIMYEVVIVVGISRSKKGCRITDLSMAVKEKKKEICEKYKFSEFEVYPRFGELYSGRKVQENDFSDRNIRWDGNPVRLFSEKIEYVVVDRDNIFQ